MTTYPLGRLVRHDPRSRAFAYKAEPRALVSVRHASHIGILDQGATGSCTGHATVAALACDPFYETLPPAFLPVDDVDAREVYSLATTLDPFPGVWPPTDTGSSGLAAAKAATKLGLISGYRHAFTVADALAALQAGPVITGFTWYESFFTPSNAGLISIKPGDYDAGGHEVCVDGYDAANQLVWCRNSWSASWGVGGRFCMTVATWSQLLAEQGDVTVFVPLAQPAPQPTPTADQQLVAAMDPWAKGIVSRLTLAGKAATAYRSWKATKGL